MPDDDRNLEAEKIGEPGQNDDTEGHKIGKPGL